MRSNNKKLPIKYQHIVSKVIYDYITASKQKI